MYMNKKILALAVASAVMAPAAMADTTIYGTITMSGDFVDGGATSANTNALATDFIMSGTSNPDIGGAWGTVALPAGIIGNAADANNASFYNSTLATNVAQARGMRPFYQALALSDDSRSRVTSNNSYIGLKGTEKINNDLSAIWQWEFSVNFDQQDTSNIGTSDAATSQSKRNTFAGLASKAAGTLTLGLQDTPTKTSTGPLDVFGNTVADYRSIIGAFNGSVRAQNSVMYTTPSLFGVVGKALYGAANETGNGNTANTSYYFAGDAHPHVSSFSLSYTGGPAYVVVAKEHNIQNGSVSAVAGGGNSSSSAPTAAPSFITGSGMNSFFMVIPDVMPATSATSLGFTAWDTVTDTTRFGVGIKFGGLKAGVAYEKTEAEISGRINRPTALNGGTTGYAGTGGTAAGAAGAGTGAAAQSFNGSADRKAYSVGVSYTLFDKLSLMGAYAIAKDISGVNCFMCGNDTGAKQTSVGASYALSKTTSVFGIYTKMHNDANGLYSVAGGSTGVAGVTPASLGETPTALSLGVKTAF
jgi:predicted porin